MMRLDPRKLLAEAGRAATADLLDRITVFQPDMEPDALDVITAELARRGIGPEEIQRHHRELRHRVVRDASGRVARCSHCPRAAVEARQGWHRVWGIFPMFPRTFYYCDEHRSA